MGPSMLAVKDRGCKVLLELGMGTGRVALQSFLECPCLRKVLGVEIERRRFVAAQTAISRLADTNPDRFRLEKCRSHGFESAVLHDGQRRLEIWWGDLLTIPVEEIRAADAIIAQIDPGSPRKHREMQALLNYAKDGCRLLSGKDLSKQWQLDAACCWHACQPESHALSEDRPWVPGGYKTFVYEAQSNIPPTIVKSEEPKNNEGSTGDSAQSVLFAVVQILALALLLFLGVAAAGAAAGAAANVLRKD